MSIKASDTTTDAFLNGRVTLVQPKSGYRAGSDPVLLAACVPARAGQSVLDVGCGAGAAGLCLAARVPGIALTGIELHAAYADLVRHNAALNGVKADIHQADISDMPHALRQQRFDHVLTNPPYFDRRGGTASPDAMRETALGEAVSLATWIAIAARRVAPKGTLTAIQKADRLPDLLTAMDPVVGSLVVLPIQPRPGRDATLVILQGKKAGRAPARLMSPMVLHDDAGFTPEAGSVLRDAAAIRLFPQRSTQ